jgi:rubrerythrin
MRDMTANNLRSAFATESQAHLENLIYAEIAGEENLSDIALLFKSIANAKRIIAKNFFSQLGDIKSITMVPSISGFGIGKTIENLKNALDHTKFIVADMYPSYKNTAQFQEEKTSALYFDFALEISKIEVSLYEEAIENLDEGKEMKLGKVGICNSCGCIFKDIIPEKCPLCESKKENFTILK